MNQACVFNSSKDPWDPQYTNENPNYKGTPLWLKKWGVNYSCIQRVIMNTSWKNYNNLGKPELLRY